MQFSLHALSFFFLSVGVSGRNRKKENEKGCLRRSLIVLFVFTIQELDIFAKIMTFFYLYVGI